MSLFTENLQILVNYSKKIDKATANNKTLEELERMQADFTRQASAGYYNREKCEILTTIANAHIDEVREVIALNAAIRETSHEINAARRREAAANKARFVDAYIYAYGSTKKAAAEVFKTASPAYIAAIIDGLKQDATRAAFED